MQLYPVPWSGLDMELDLAGSPGNPCAEVGIDLVQQEPIGAEQNATLRS